jgi:glutathione peroxidase
MKIARCALALLLLSLFAISASAQTREVVLNELTTIPFETINGDTMTLADFGGKVILVVNVASKCGYTPQYAGLETLYEKYGSDSFAVIGFPANNFKGQEPGTNEEIQTFCSTTYGVTFPMMAKISVIGDDMHAQQSAR